MKRCRVGRRRFLPRKQRCCMGDAGPHAIEQVVASGIISAIQGMPESHRVGRAMALEDQPTKTKQGSAIVPTVIKTLFKRF